MRYVPADLDHRACCFMTKDHRLVDYEISDTPMCIIMHIAPAYAYGVQFDTNVIRPHLGRQFNFAQIQFADAFQNKCFHRIIPDFVFW